jgi:uncharacterized protein (TIGR02001 family)
MKGQKMNKVLVTAAVLLGLSAAPSLAADLKMYTKAAPAVVVSPWDIAFGAAIASDYNFRGISQSDRGASVSAYFEPRYNMNPNLQLYAGIAGSSVKLATDPTAEIDLYGGIRPTFGALALDFGFMYYLYPHEREIDGLLVTAPPSFNTSLKNTDFWEVYAKATYTFNDQFSVGANLYYSPDWLNTGADGTYLSGTAKYVMPATFLPSGVGMYVSGELGYYWLGTTDLAVSSTGFAVYVNNAGTGGIDLPSYAYWNAGIGFTYKVLTLDLRYHDTNLNKDECNALTGDPGANASGGVIVGNSTQFGSSNWCGSAFVAKLSFDTTLAAFK